MITTVTNNDPKSINTSLFDLEKQIEKEIDNIKSDVSTVSTKISEINASETVYSVNGKTGIVELDASDVGALSNTTVIPETTSQLKNTSGYITIDDVSDAYVPVTRKVNDKELNNDITLSASDVGALPDSTFIPTTAADVGALPDTTTHLSGDIPTSEKGAASGVATLDEYGKVPASELPSAVMQYKGAWDASTNTPTLTNGMTSAVQGDVYVCNVAGTVDFGAGDITCYEGDWVMYNGTIWERSANANLVKSVNGKDGVVELTASDVGALPTTGGAMTGAIQYKGTNATTNAIQFMDNTADAYGNGVVIGAGGLTVIGGGESATTYKNNTSETAGTENMVVCNDGDVNIVTNLQSGYSNGKTFKFGSDGTLTTPSTFWVVGGCGQASSKTFSDLLNNELGSSSNTGGIRGGSISTTSTSLGISAGWYNFLYIPHRSGLPNTSEEDSKDNNKYGTLLVFPMDTNSSNFYIIHRIGGNNYSAITK